MQNLIYIESFCRDSAQKDPARLMCLDSTQQEIKFP